MRKCIIEDAFIDSREACDISKNYKYERNEVNILMQKVMNVCFFFLNQEVMIVEWLLIQFQVYWLGKICYLFHMATLHEFIWKLAVISEGNQVPGEQEFDLCFGGRRQFCETEYADLGKGIFAVFFKSECHYLFSGSFHMDNMQFAINSKLTLSKAQHWIMFYKLSEKKA